MIWFKASIENVLQELSTSREGISDQEAKKRRRECGPNRIQRAKKVSPWKVLFHQFTSPLVYVLVGALVLTLVIQSMADAVVIGAVLVINATIGFIQEYNAETAVQSLMEMVTPQAKVIRSGERKEIDSSDLVPGDVVELEQGKMVPADLRLIETNSLEVNEAALTGESVPVSKFEETLEDAEEDLSTSDQKNMAFMGTAVTAGSGMAVVVATGRETKIGEIAQQVQEAGRIETPLEKRIRRLSKWITGVILVVAVIAVVAGWLAGRSFFDMILLGVALAVAAIPAGLPIVVTVALALGVKRMARRHAMIRHLPAVDTLGSTTLILSDKTGTLTQNQMTVRAIFDGEKRMDVAGGGKSLSGKLLYKEEPVEIEEKLPLWYTLLAGCLCNEAENSPIEETQKTSEKEQGPAEEEESKKELDTSGDPLEVALLVVAVKAGLDRERFRQRYPQVDKVPFQTERRFMATVHRNEEEEDRLVLVKGAPEKILEMCDRRLDQKGRETELDPERIRQEADRMADQGLRLLALAIGHGQQAAETVRKNNPEGLVFVGLQGMLDPPRQSAIRAVEECYGAGIRVIMMTGDHARTAASMAEKILPGESEFRQKTEQESGNEPSIGQEKEPISGKQIAQMEDRDLQEAIGRTNVFARVEPAQKLRIVDHFKSCGEVVAVTGDGVNDAPALKNAHIGAAMGSGTDVAKEASDMVVTDDNFASVYAAVEEGRVAFRNIRMATFFLLSTGAADILIILAALAVGWPLPLLPAQILWCNVVTNGIADVALAFEPGDPALFRRPPRSPDAGMLDRLLLERLVLVGLWLAMGTLFMFWWKSGGGRENIRLARTAALTTLILFQVVHVFNCRSEDVSIFRKSLLSNTVLFIGVLASLGVHIGALYLPLTQKYLRFAPLDARTWLTAIGIALTAIVLNELHKKLRSRTDTVRGRQGIISSVNCIGFMEK